MEPVLISFFGAIAAFFTWRTSVRTKKIDKKTETNHGKQPWQYLEMVMVVRDEVRRVAKDLAHVKQETGTVRQSQDDLHEALIEHTAQDSTNFDVLAELIKDASGVSEARADAVKSDLQNFNEGNQ